MTVAPSTVVTFLFTDLEGSTGLWERHPDAMHDALARHDAILRHSAETNDGRVVKTLGDGMHCAFAHATDGVRCAVAAQLALQSEEWGATGRLRVRMGLHTGEALARDGDYYGTALNRAARLMGIAHSDQILISSASQRLVALEQPVEIGLVDLGQHHLRGLAGLEQVYQVTHPGLPTDFPSLASLDVSLEDLASQLSVPFPPRLRAPHSFIGRPSELATLRSCWDAAKGGTTQLALVAGEPGIGKTSLVARAAADAGADGGVVLSGRCDEDLGVPYAPFVEAIGELVSHAPGPLLRAHLEEYGPHLARLVPTLRRYVAPSEGALDADAAAERLQLFASIAKLLELVASSHGMVLVLDDVHWADQPTIVLLRHLIERASPMRLLIAATYRDSEVTGAPLADLLAALRRSRGVERVELSGMDEADVVRLLETAAGQPMEEVGIRLAGALARDTGGNPFYVGELLRHLAERGVLSRGESGRWELTAELDQLGLPDSVREVIGQRVARLGDETQRVLAAAAVVGRGFELPVLARALEEHDDRVLDQLEGAERAALVRNIAGDEFQFVHALVQQSLYQGLGAARRSRLHLRVAEALESLGSADANPQEVAHHLVSSGGRDARARAIAYLRKAGDTAIGALAPDEAVRQYREALRLAEEVDAGDDERCELLVSLGDALRQAGDLSHRGVLLDASALARDVGNREQLALAVLANNRGWASRAGIVDHERVAMAEAALDAIGGDPTATRARLLSVLASELTYGGDLDRRRALSDEAVAIARRIDDPATLSSVLSSRFNAIRVPHMLPSLLSETEENLALANALGDGVAQWSAATQRMQISVEACDGTAVDAALDAEVRLADELRLPYPRWLTAAHRATRAMLAGELDECERLANEALKVGSDGGQADAVQIYAGQLFYLRTAQGRADELVGPLAHSAQGDRSLIPFVMGARGALALTYSTLGRAAEAHTVLTAAAADAFAGVPLDGEWLNTLLLFADVSADLDDTETAVVLFDLLAPFGSQAGADGINVGGTVARLLGRLGATLGRDDVDHWFAHAGELERRLRAPVLEANTQAHWAAVLARRGTSESRARALELAAQARRTASERGARTVVERADAVLASSA